MDTVAGPWTTLRTHSPVGPSALLLLASLSAPLKGPSRATRMSHRLTGRDLETHVCGSGQSLAGKARVEPRAENMPCATAQLSLLLVQGPWFVRRLLGHEQR